MDISLMLMLLFIPILIELIIFIIFICNYCIAIINYEDKHHGNDKHHLQDENEQEESSIIITMEDVD